MRCSPPPVCCVRALSLFPLASLLALSLFLVDVPPSPSRPSLRFLCRHLSRALSLTLFLSLSLVHSLSLSPSLSLHMRALSPVLVLILCYKFTRIRTHARLLSRTCYQHLLPQPTDVRAISICCLNRMVCARRYAFYTISSKPARVQPATQRAVPADERALPADSPR